jgi:PBSX family phage terminase large subunit
MSSDGVQLTDLIGPAFYGVHNAIRANVYSSFWLRGGRGSLKSSFTAIEIVKGIVEDPLANGIAFRKTAASLKDSVRPTFEWAIDKLGWSLFFKTHKSDDEITYLPTGQKIMLRGLDDAQKMKSVKTKKGYLKYLWFEEGAEYTDLEEMESVRISVLRGGTVFTEFVTYNPPAEPFAWINEEARRVDPSRLVHQSNYKQSPPEWLGPQFLKDAAAMEKDRPEKHAHVYMGVEVGRTDAIIFSGCYRVESFTPEPDWDGPYFGADFGFSQDPNTLVKVWIKDRNLYIEYEEYGIGVMLDDMPKMYDKIPDSRRYKIRADCSRPETIAHLKARGFDIEAAEKWSGSVEDGITIMKSYNIVIHPRCVNLIQEMRSYRYKIDRLTRDVLPDIISKYDHGIDACRYALAPLIKKKNGWFM